MTIDAGSGAVLRTQVQSFEGSVLWTSGDGGVTWTVAAGMIGAPLRVASAKPGIGGVAAFAVTVDRAHLRLWVSNDGQAWQALGELPAAAGDWVRSMAWSGSTGKVTLLLATPTGLWRYGIADGAVTAEEIDGQVTGLSTADDGIEYAVAVQRAGEGGRLYARVDDRWSPAGGLPADRLAALDGRVVPFGQGAGHPSGLPAANSVAGTGPRLLAAGGASSLRYSSDGGASWKAAMGVGAADVVQVATAPAFSDSGVALAGSFRGPVFRSSDYGATWAKVAGPEGEVGALVFVSDSIALCVEGGTLTWIDF